jgi:hypothetical protein
MTGQNPWNLCPGAKSSQNCKASGCPERYSLLGAHQLWPLSSSPLLGPVAITVEGHTRPKLPRDRVAAIGSSAASERGY